MSLDNVEDVFSLSPLQEGMLYHTITEPDSGVFVEQICVSLEGLLNVEILKQAWSRIAHRHVCLRSVFVWDGLEQPVQVVHTEIETPWTLHDWRDEPAEAKLQQLLAADRRRGHDLELSPVTRMFLVREDDERWKWIWSFHHLMCDGWSVAIVLRELFSQYAALHSGNEIYLDSVFEHREYVGWLRSKSPADTVEFWKERLSGFVAPVRPRLYIPSKSTSEDKTLQTSKRLSSQVTDRIVQLARAYQVTLNTVVQGMWALLLCRVSGEEDVVYGTTMSGRTHELPGIEDAVGNFINTLPVRVQVDGECETKSYLQQLQRELLSILEVQHSSLPVVQKLSDVAAGDALFESIVVFENYPPSNFDALSATGLEVGAVQYLEQSNFPLALLVVPGQELELILVHRTPKYGEDAAKLLLGCLENLLTELVDSSKPRLRDLSLCGQSKEMLAAARQHLTNTISEDPDANFDGFDTACQLIHSPIEWHALHRPDAIAVKSEETKLTYRELDRRANGVAQALFNAGVAIGDRVGICADRSAEFIVGVLGVLKAGGSYVPLDPTYPAHRGQLVMDTAQIHTVLLQQKHRDYLHGTPARLIELENVDPLDQFVGTSLESSDAIAYVIFTSGSTGNPKGVAVRHRNIWHSTRARMMYYEDKPESFLLLSAIGFDSSLAGLFWTLCSGGTLVLPRTGQEQQMHELVELIQHHQVTHTLCLPTLYRLLIREAPNRLDSLKCVMVAGESCPRDLCEEHYQTLPNAELFNEYGPTEASVWSTVAKLRPGEESVPIGYPIPGAQVGLLDVHGQLLPDGVVGELYVGGAGVAQGYWDRSDLTAESFVQIDALSHNASDVFYRTGDLACRQSDGQYLFQGRCDTQVKVRGFRIELEEIQSALLQHPAVDDAAVVPTAAAKAGIYRSEILDLDERLSLAGDDAANDMLSRLMQLSDQEVRRQLNAPQRINEYVDHGVSLDSDLDGKQKTSDT